MVTLLIPSAFSIAAKEELQRYTFDPQRLHIVHIAVGDSGSIATEAKSSGQFMILSKATTLIEPAVAALIAAYSRLIQHQPLTDTITGKSVVSFDVTPSVALIDITLAGQVVAALRKSNLTANVHVKLLCLAPLSAQWALWSEVQESAGTYLGYAERCRKILAASEEERQVAYSKWIGENEDFVEVPGLPLTRERFGLNDRGKLIADVFEMCPNQRECITHRYRRLTGSRRVRGSHVICA